MPDWQKLVRRRLSGLAVDFNEKEEIHTELAAHLEESYEALCTEGLSEHDAVQKTLAQVSDWKDLQRKILIVKRRRHPMHKRLHQLWIPGFLSLVLSMFPIGFILGRIIGRQVGFGVVATTLLRDGIGWLLVPGAALLAGGLLVHILFGRRSSSQD